LISEFLIADAVDYLNPSKSLSVPPDLPPPCEISGIRFRFSTGRWKGRKISWFQSARYERGSSTESVVPILEPSLRLPDLLDFLFKISQIVAERLGADK
jgi:hypothetical protein